ncbi:hypothetical protein EU527_08375, partial [Candidatus Thorarchaeota archaeon]
MSQKESTNPVEIAKVLGAIYGSLVILLSVLLFLSVPYFTLLPTYAVLTPFILMWLVGGTIVLIGAELAWQLKKSGMTIIGFFVFLLLNLLIVVMTLAVFADIVTPTIAD